MNKRQAKKDLKKQFGISAKHHPPRYVKMIALMVRSMIAEEFEAAVLYGYGSREEPARNPFQTDPFKPFQYNI